MTIQIVYRDRDEYLEEVREQTEIDGLREQVRTLESQIAALQAEIDKRQ